MKIIYPALGILIAVLAGCKPSPSTLTPAPFTEGTDETTVPIATWEPTQTETPAPTATDLLPVTATPTVTEQPASTLIPSPAPEPIVVTAGEQAVNGYLGPGPAYPLVAIFSPGFQVEVVGTGGNGEWLVVQLPPDNTVWIRRGDVQETFVLDGLLVFADPPVPTSTPTPVPVPMVTISPTALAPSAEYNIYISGLQPHEHFTIKVVSQNTGRTELAAGGFARQDGTADMNLFTNDNAEVGAYLIVVVGDLGSYAQAEFFIGPPP